MTNSETIRVEAIATAIYDTLVADGWTTPECEGDSRGDGNGIYYRYFSKEGYADITQGYAVADPNAWRSYVTSLTLGCDGKIIRCTDGATSKKLRAFLVRADKLQDIAKAKAIRVGELKAEAKKLSDFLAKYVKQTCGHTWENHQDAQIAYEKLQTAMSAKVKQVNKDNGFEKRDIVVEVKTPYEPYGGLRCAEYLEESLSSDFRVRILNTAMNAEEVNRFQETLAGVMLIFLGAEGDALRDAYLKGGRMAIALNEAEDGGHEAYKADNNLEVE
jgi:ribosomal protein L34E